MRQTLCRLCVGPWRSVRYVASAAQGESRSHESFMPVPMAERDGKAVATAAQVLEWRGWARGHAADVESRADRRDGLPPLESLLTELDWIVEDAVAGMREKVGHSGSGGVWRGSGQLLDGNGPQRSCQVLLREDLDGLRRMWTTRLRDRVPVQYLTESCHWRDLVLVVTPAVLIPRPETELMVDFVAEALKQRPALANAPWADFGTGSGALAIGIAAEIAKTHNSGGAARIFGDGRALVHAVDLSPMAVVVARQNAIRTVGLSGDG